MPSIFTKPETPVGILRQLQAAYLDYINDYLTIEVYAEHNGLAVDEAKQIIAIGKGLHETGGYLADR